METADGQEGVAFEGIADQRRCRRLTMVPSLSAVDDSEAESNIGQGEFLDLLNPVLSASLAGFDVDCAGANGVSNQQVRESKQVNGSGVSLELLQSSIPEVEEDLKERGWGEEESSPTVHDLPRAMIKESGRDHGNAKIIDRLPAQGASGSKFATSGHKPDRLAKGAVEGRGTRIRPWRGPLPRPKPALLPVLGDFLPRKLTDQPCRAISEEKSGLGSPGKKSTLDGPSDHVGYSQEQLRERAKFFGRPKLDLQAYRAKRLGKNLISFPAVRAQIQSTTSLRRLQVAESFPRQEDR
jgi:hypothetical protein